jgi:hypothetical protein
MTARVSRRGWLIGAAALAVAPAAVAHTPYRQWVVYRQRHLLIGCHKGDPDAYARAKAMEAWLAEALPDARARTARAPHPGRLASLFATDQLHLGLLRAAEAVAMRAGREPFAPYGAVPLEAVAAVGEHLLCTVPSFAGDHVGLLLDALADAPAELRPGAPPPDVAPPHAAAAHWFAHHRG